PEPSTRRIHPSRRLPVRDLHAGSDHRRHGLAARTAETNGRPGACLDDGQPVPLHRLLPDRRQHSGRLRSPVAGVTLDELTAPEYRVEGHLKVTGRARYAADVRQTGMLWAAYARSPLPHA